MSRLVLITLCMLLVATSCTPTPELPVLSTSAGSYSEEFTVSIVNLADGERAYYTLDGSDPDESSTRYTEKGIPLTEGDNLVKIIKYDSEGTGSKILTATFDIAPQMPRLATPDGVYNRVFSAAIVNLKDDQTAYYTLDGSQPNQNSTRYTEDGIPLTEGENLVKVVKYDKGGNVSPLLTAELTIEPYEPDYSNQFTMAAKQGNHIYYVQAIPGEFSEYTSILYSRLYRYNIADGTRHVVLDEDVSRFLIRDGVVYYEETLYKYGEDEGVYFLLHRVDLDGKNRKEILRYEEEDINYLGIMVDQWIYYSYRDSSARGSSWELYRINADTLETERINDGGYSTLLLDRDLYSTGLEDGGIYRYNADTEQTEQISTDHAIWTKAYGSFIYYFNDYPAPSINRIRTDGTDKTRIPVRSSTCYAVVGDRIIHGYTTSIHSSRIDGTEKTQLSLLVPSSMEYYRDKIYFYRFQAPSPMLYLLDLDTGQVTELTEAEGELYFFDGEVYLVCTNLWEDMAGLYKLTETGMQKLAGVPAD